MKLQNIIWSLKQKTSKKKASELLVKVLVRLVKNLHRNFVYLMLKVGRSIYTCTYVHVLMQKYEDSLIQGRWIIYFLYEFIQICFSGFTIHCITQYLLKCTCSSTCQSFRMTGCRRMSILDASFVNVTVLHSFHWLFISLSLIVRKYEWICEEKNKCCLYIFTFDIYSICHWKHLVWKDLFWTIIFWIVDSQHRYIDLMISLYTYM